MSDCTKILKKFWKPKDMDEAIYLGIKLSAQQMGLIAEQIGFKVISMEPLFGEQETLDRYVLQIEKP